MPSRISKARMSATGATVGPFARLRPGADLGERLEGRQFLRGEERPDRRGRQGQPSDLYRRCDRSAPAAISARARSPATMTASTSTRPVSAQTPSSARTRRWLRRSRIGDGAYIASGSVITDDVPAEALAFGRARQEVKPGACQGNSRARSGHQGGEEGESLRPLCVTAGNRK